MNAVTRSLFLRVNLGALGSSSSIRHAEMLVMRLTGVKRTVRPLPLMLPSDAHLYTDGWLHICESVHENTGEAIHTKSWRESSSQTLVMHDHGANLVILIIGDPHLLKCAQRCQDGATSWGKVKIISTTPTPHCCKKTMLSKHAIKWAIVWHENPWPSKDRDFHRKYGKWTPQNRAYEPPKHGIVWYEPHRFYRGWEWSSMHWEGSLEN